MMKQQSIFIVEDEAAIREVVRKYLELDGSQVLEADTGTQALEMLREHSVDLILLDIMLPGLDGLTITRSIRNDYNYLANSSGVPIIILTSRGTETDRLMGFELGADDYIVKPFSPRELVARVKAVLRRGAADGPGATEKALVFDNLRIDPRERSVAVNDVLIPLTAKEFELLWFFARHPRQVFTREQLLNEVWGYEFYGDESTVTVHIRRLREKVESDPAAPNYIQTVWGIGYKFEA